MFPFALESTLSDTTGSNIDHITHSLDGSKHQYDHKPIFTW